jgi:hypothetical protein
VTPPPPPPPPPPNSSRIDRTALDRIIQRAAELQTGEREIGDNLSPEEVLALGAEVGIPSRYLQQAILEHQAARAAPAAQAGVVSRVVGPAEVRSQRVVQGEVEAAIRSLLAWMEKNELLVVQRQQPGWVSWEPLRGMQAAIRRGTAALDTSKPRFMLSRAETVVATVTPLEQGYVHVTLVAALGKVRAEHLVGAGVSAGIGAASAVLLGILGLAPLIVVAPFVPMGLATAAWLRKYRPVAARVELGLERALDFLERGGVKPGHEFPARGPGLLEVLAGEVRRALSAGGQAAHEARGRFPSARAPRGPDGP